MLTRYIYDMQPALDETSKVLADNGQAAYVIGENIVRGRFIRNATTVKAVDTVNFDSLVDAEDL